MKKYTSYSSPKKVYFIKSRTLAEILMILEVES